jgi:hypothetical protein
MLQLTGCAKENAPHALSNLAKHIHVENTVSRLVSVLQPAYPLIRAQLLPGFSLSDQAAAKLAFSGVLDKLL